MSVCVCVWIVWILRKPNTQNQTRRKACVGDTVYLPYQQTGGPVLAEPPAPTSSPPPRKDRPALAAAAGPSGALSSASDRSSLSVYRLDAHGVRAQRPHWVARFWRGATSGTHAAGARHAAAGSKTAVRRGRRREGSPTAKVPGKPSGAVVGGGAARPWPHAGSERVLHEPCWAAEGIREPYHCARPAQAGAASEHLCADHPRLHGRDERLIAQIGTGQLARRVRAARTGSTRSSVPIRHNIVDAWRTYHVSQS